MAVGLAVAKLVLFSLISCTPADTVVLATGCTKVIIGVVEASNVNLILNTYLIGLVSAIVYT